MPTLYGIRNCDTVRKARRWLDDHGVVYAWHDLRADGLPGEMLDRWLDAVGDAVLVNRRGRTWRQLPEATRDGLDAAGLRSLLLEQPTLVKRPVLDDDGDIVVGFDADDYAGRFDGRGSTA
jgi:arsenate reductase